MPLSKFIFRPGIMREGTDYDNEGGWFDGNLVRFKSGRAEKIGGWRKDSVNTFIGTCRELSSWVTLDGSKYLGLGTHKKYFIQDGDVYFDITPLRLTTGANEISFAATSGSNILTITDTAHGAVQGDFVTYSGCASLGGSGLISAAVLNQEYEIATVTSANVYTILAKDTSGNSVSANGNDTGNGQGTVVGKYQINVGLDNYVQSTGWGAGLWGGGTFGSATALSFVNQLRLWSADNFGEDLVSCARNGGIFYWDVSAKTLGTDRAVLLSGITGANQVPTVGLQVITSETDRHLIVLGADPLSGDTRTGVIDPMLIAFSDQENSLEFEAKTTNTAGSLRLSAGSTIVGSVKARQEILIWTDTALYSMQFIGSPFTFGLNLINNNTGLIAPNAAVTSPAGVYWMGYDSFYSYNGSVQKIPCSVLSYVFDNLNVSQSYKTVAFTNNKFNEVGWFYVSSDSTEIDKYVSYNYAEKSWSYGTLSRTAWLDSGTVNFPRATSSSYLYEHEFGYDDDGSPMTNVFIESSDFDIGDGEQFAFISKIIPDLRFVSNSSGGAVNMVLKTRDSPGDTLATNSTSVITSTTSESFVRARARQATVRIESDDDDVSSNTSTGWRLGATRLDVRPDGRR
tara:strand:- start:1098 stop:2975 length:1878 start_codon:yes stop_codon:yes gene_type:complete